MTIQKAQEIYVNFPQSDDPNKEEFIEALSIISEALHNGYQLCKVDEMKKNIKYKSTMMADCNYPLGDSMEYGLYVKDIEEMIKEACE